MDRFGISDEGLQAERTSLSWSRTFFSFCVLALLFVKISPALGSAALLVSILSVISVLPIPLGNKKRYASMSNSIYKNSGSAAVVYKLFISSFVVFVSVLSSLVVWFR